MIYSRLLLSMSGTDESRKEEMEMMHVSFSAGARLLLRGGGGRWDIAQRPPKISPRFRV